MCIALFHFKTCVVALLYSTGVSFVWIRARLCVVLLLVLGLSKYMDDEMDAGLEPPVVLMLETPLAISSKLSSHHHG